MNEDANNNEEAPAEVIIPWQQLSSEVLHKIAQEFVLREGTDYGLQEFSLEEKTEQVLKAVKSGKAQIHYESQEGTVTIVPIG